jgi:predicted dehydrogenase
MRVLVIGSGMYVTGRGAPMLGIVIPALAEVSRTLPLERVLIAARDNTNAAHVKSSTDKVNAILSTRLKTEYTTIPGRDLERETAELCAAEHFDCAIVAIPDDLHAPPVRALLRAKVPPLVVKPFVPTLAEARDLVDLQRKTGTYGAVEFHKRFDESNLYAKKVIAEKQLGKLLYMNIDYSQRIQIPKAIFREWAGRTNIFQYLGVHYVDLVSFLTGFVPKRLTAHGTKHALRELGIDTYDSVHVMAEWANPGDDSDRLYTHYNTNWIDPDCTTAMSDQRFRIVGTTGHIACDQRYRGIEIVREGIGVVQPNPYFCDYLPALSGENRYQGYGVTSVRQFIADVQDLAQGRATLAYLNTHRPSFEASLPSTAFIDAVNRALKRQHTWLEVDDFR